MNYGLLLAAGEGQRFGGTKPKQFQDLAGKKVLQYSVETFEDSEVLSGYGLMIPGKNRNSTDEFTEKNNEKCLFVEPGGSSRRQTVYKGLKCLRKFSPDKVLIHDAARPMIDEKLLEKLFSTLESDGSAAGVIPTRPLRDTIKKVSAGENKVVETLDREVLRRVQTPQVFSFSKLFAVHANWDPEEQVTDDAMMLESKGEKILTVEGPRENIKLTYPGDEKILATYRGEMTDEQ